MVIVGASVDRFSEVIVTSSFTMSFDEKLFVFYFISLVASERRSVSDLILSCSITKIILHSICCFLSTASVLVVDLPGLLLFFQIFYHI